MSYRLATGNMLKVWATGECPICGNDMDHLCFDLEPANSDKWLKAKNDPTVVLTQEDLETIHLDTYTCEYCYVLVTYVSPARYKEYHEVPDSEKRYIIDRG